MMKPTTTVRSLPPLLSRRRPPRRQSCAKSAAWWRLLVASSAASAAAAAVPVGNAQSAAAGGCCASDEAVESLQSQSQQSIESRSAAASADDVVVLGGQRTSRDYHQYSSANGDGPCCDDGEDAADVIITTSGSSIVAVTVGGDNCGRRSGRRRRSGREVVGPRRREATGAKKQHDLRSRNKLRRPRSPRPSTSESRKTAYTNDFRRRSAPSAESEEAAANKAAAAAAAAAAAKKQTTILSVGPQQPHFDCGPPPEATVVSEREASAAEVANSQSSEKPLLSENAASSVVDTWSGDSADPSTVKSEKSASCGDDSDICPSSSSSSPEALPVAREEIPPAVLQTLEAGAKKESLSPAEKKNCCSSKLTVAAPVLAATEHLGAAAAAAIPTITDNIRFTLPGTYDIELVEPRYHDKVDSKKIPAGDAAESAGANGLRTCHVTTEVVGECHQHPETALSLPGRWALCAERKRRLIAHSTATFPVDAAAPPSVMRSIAPIETSELLNGAQPESTDEGAGNTAAGSAASPMSPTDIAALAEQELRMCLDKCSESRVGKTWTKYWHGKDAKSGDVVVSHSHSVYRDSVDVLQDSNQTHYYPLAARALHLSTGLEAVGGQTKFLRTREVVLSMTNLDALADPSCKGHYILTSHSGKSSQSSRRVMDESAATKCCSKTAL